MVIDSCHNCGTQEEHLQVVSIVKDGVCGEPIHHVHVIVACDSCKKSIWKQSTGSFIYIGARD